MEKRLIECVPNFSEGRDRGKIDAIVEAITSAATARGLRLTEQSEEDGWVALAFVKS